MKLTDKNPMTAELYGELRPMTKEEIEAAELANLNAVLRGMSSHQIEGAIAAELEPIQKRAWLRGGSSPASPQELYDARQRALRNLPESEYAKRVAEAEAREAAKDTPDEQARARVLRIHQAKLDQRLALMTAETRKVWDSEVAVARAGIASAQVRNAADEIKIFEQRLDALGALPPAEDDLEALLEPEVHAWGINGSEHEAEVARLKAKHNLGDDLKPKTTTRKTAAARR